MPVLALPVRSTSHSHSHRAMKRRHSAFALSHSTTAAPPKRHRSSYSFRISVPPLSPTACRTSCLLPALRYTSAASRPSPVTGVVQCRIRLPDRSTTVLTLDNKQTVRTLRAMLAERMGVSADSVALYRSFPSELSDTLLLTHCHITNSTTIISGWRQREAEEGGHHAVWNGKRSVLSRIDE